MNPATRTDSGQTRREMGTQSQGSHTPVRLPSRQFDSLVSGLRHGGCPEMTRSVHIVERMRWMSALAGAAVLALAVVIVFAVTSGQLRSVVPGSSAAPVGGSSAPLDPRIATLARQHPTRVLQAIVQFNGPVTQAKAQADAG